MAEIPTPLDAVDLPVLLSSAVVKSPKMEGNMLYWALVFLVVALIAGVLGFTGIAVAAAGVAKLLFVVFLILFLISLITHFSRGSTVR